MTAPKPSAAEVAAEQFIDTLWDGTGYRSPDLAELAAAFDAFAAEAVAAAVTSNADAWALVDEAENIIREYSPGNTVWLEQAARFLRGVR